MKKIISTLLGVLLVTVAVSSPVFAADEEKPSNVENFQGTEYNSALKITWDEATDNVGVEGYILHYGLTPVEETGEVYDETVDTGNVTEHLLTGLENDSIYYLSVVAYDAAGNESAKWATQLELTPTEDAGDYSDDVAPTVAGAEALNKVEVSVEFSEEVVIPDEDPQDAFQVENDDDLEPLAVLDAKMDEEDDTNKTVILTTDEQTEGATYKLTVTIDVEDKAGNPVISGTSDTAIFDGSGEEKLAEDETGPELMKVQSVDNTHVEVEFNEVIKLGIDPSENFNIAEEADPTVTLTVLGVELAPNGEGVDDAAAIITTTAQENKSYILTALELEDEAGNEVEATKSSGIFQGIPAEDGDDDDDDDDDAVAPDDEGPKDVAELLADVAKEAEKYIVTLSWDVVEENAGKVTQQILYLSEDNKAYDQKADIDPEASQYEVKDLEAGEYWFKLTQKDATGNESEGIIKKVILAETGPGVVGLILVSLGLGRLVTRRKK